MTTPPDPATCRRLALWARAMHGAPWPTSDVLAASMTGIAAQLEAAAGMAERHAAETDRLDLAWADCRQRLVAETAAGDLVTAEREAARTEADQLRARVAALEGALTWTLPMLEAGRAFAGNEFLGDGGQVVDLKAQLFAAYHGVTADDVERVRDLAAARIAGR